MLNIAIEAMTQSKCRGFPQLQAMVDLSSSFWVCLPGRVTSIFLWFSYGFPMVSPAGLPNLGLPGPPWTATTAASDPGDPGFPWTLLG